MKNWTAERDADGVVSLTLDKPGTSANVLSRDVLAELGELVAPFAADPPRGVIVRSGKPSGFVAGADINEFTKLASVEEAFDLVRRGQQVFDRLEALPCPTVAAIHGFALGGGLELALACRHRVALGDERLSLGFPEVQLGIHPGFGGTVRSVRLVGVRAAMELMLTGKPVRADKALALGLVDALASDAAALAAKARELVLSRASPHRPPFTQRILNAGPLRPFVARALVAQVGRRARREHYPAPYAMIDLWVRHGAGGQAAYEAEARSIAELFLSPTARNLVRVFFLQDRLKALGGKTARDASHVHVVGAGVMGGDIAAWCALRGFEVTLQDRTMDLVAPALKRAEELFAKRQRDPQKAQAARARLKADVEGAGVPKADFVIEAIFENLDAKRELYAKLEPRMKPDAILATNTSSIMLEPLAQPLARPARFVGLHFFNPVPQMPLVEIVRGRETDPAVAQAALGFARRLDKLPVPCRSAPGFVVNRVLMPYLNEAMFAAQEGVPLPLIDQAAVSFGMPMGPVELADVIGLDVASHVGEIVARELGRTPPDLTQLRGLVGAKKLGRKTGEGFYVWRDGKAVKPELGSAQPPDDLTDRLILPLVNECAACLREGVVEDSDLLDAAVIFGTGFAPFRGGPLQYARERGVDRVRARLADLVQRYGSRFQPDAGWSRLMPEGKA
jgi:3-hydroxyacyl-CoA dehydrogenase/enoyl-CoA hydratase/3-hydroxybutyryl-CoA epimerase